MIYKIISISLASPLQIIKWSCNYYLNKFNFAKEITIPLTYSIQNILPAHKGLFCENIFGNLINNLCCFNFHKIIFNKNDLFCYNCNVIQSSLYYNRHNIGYIRLTIPIGHSWYLTTYLPIILESNSKILMKIFCYRYFLIDNKIQPNKLNILPLIKSAIISKDLLHINILIYRYLYKINLLNTLYLCRYKHTLFNSKFIKYILLKKLRILHLLFISGLRPEWMLITILPVMPPGLRPIIYLSKVGFISSPFNNLYRKIIIHNNKLYNYTVIKNSVFIIIEQCLLQQTINKLFENIFSITKSSKLQIISFLNKQYYFKQYILGKRVDFSGRSSIISGPNLQIGEIGLSYSILIELLYFYIFRIHLTLINYNNINKTLYISYTPIILRRWVRKLINIKSLILNRAPTLHKFNIQTSKIRLVETEAFQFYPLLCSSFNADFDGDQIGIFLPIFLESIYETKTKLYLDNNVLSLITPAPMLKLNHNMILGIYYRLFLMHNYLFNYYFYSDIEDLIDNQNLLLIEPQKLVWIRLLYIYNPKDFFTGFLFTNLQKISLYNNINLNNKIYSIFI